MDMIKIGKFIARLRKEQGLTQEQFGEKIGVTNKTVSRWEDKIDFFKKKWLKDHIAIMVFLGVCIIGVFVGGMLLKNVPVCYGAFLLLVVAHCWRNNTMMTYVEKNAFDGTGNT